MDENVSKTDGVENNGVSRRKAVKVIIGSVTALAAYQAFPSKWGTPVIEQVLLPAHAQTSGPAETVSGTARNVALPDRVDIDINIPIGSGQLSIVKVTLALDITHTWNGDLRINLTSPGGTTRLLVDTVCGGNDNMNILLDDAAGSQVGSGCGSPYTGTYNTGGNLDAFIGEDPNGTWVLNIVDVFGADFGTLNSATLTVTAD